MLKNNLGYPRMGANRELKKACEQYWSGAIGREQLLLVAKSIRQLNWKLQQEAGIDLHLIKPVDPVKLQDLLERFSRFVVPPTEGAGPLPS